MNFIKKNAIKCKMTSKLKVIVSIILAISISLIALVLAVKFVPKEDDLYNEKKYNNRYTQNYKEEFAMENSSGKLEDKFKNISMSIDSKKYDVGIYKLDDKDFLVMKDENSLSRKIQLPKDMSSKKFINGNLDEYMNSSLPLLIHLSYNFYMDEAHKFLGDIDSAKKTPVQTEYYVKDNKLLVKHNSEFYGQIKNLFVFEKNGSISITKYKKGA